MLQDANRVDGVVSQVVSTTEQERRSKVLDIYKSGLQLSESDTDKFCKFLADHHAAFCLAEGERGETDMVQMNIWMQYQEDKHLGVCLLQSEVRLTSKSKRWPMQE